MNFDETRTIYKRVYIRGPSEIDLEMAAGKTAEALVSMTGGAPFRLLIGQVVARGSVVGFKSKSDPLVYRAEQIKHLRYFEYI
jgi:hypothetical protein